MSATEPTANPRQWLSARRSATVNELLDATLVELREVGFDQLSIRSVAQRAGVTHTTAYGYFTSKGHLVAELHWRILRDTPEADVAADASFAERVEAAFLGPTIGVAEEHAVANGIFNSVLGDDPDIRRLREAVGSELDRRLRLALGPFDSTEIREIFLVFYSGAMLTAGVGLGEFDGVVHRMGALARLIDLSRIEPVDTND